MLTKRWERKRERVGGGGEENRESEEKQEQGAVGEKAVTQACTVHVLNKVFHSHTARKQTI